MSEIAPGAAPRGTRWLVPAYATLAATSLIAAAGLLLAAPPTGRATAFAGAALGFVAWTFTLVRLRRVTPRAAQQRIQWTLAAWFALFLAAVALLTQSGHLGAAWPAVLTIAATLTALYGTFHEAVR